MAYQQEEEDKQEEGSGKSTGPETGIISAQGATGTGAEGASGQGQAPAAGEPTSGSQFVGINQYIDANKPQAAKLAESVGTYVEGQGRDARDSLTLGQGQFNQAVGKNTVNLNQKIFNTAKNVTGATGAEDLTEVEKQEFIKMRDAQYNGPTSLESSEYWNPINTAFKKAQDVTKQSLNLEGQQNLLSQFQQDTRGRVNKGAVDFDATLLQGDQEARDILSKSAAKNADLSGLLTQAHQDAIDLAGKAKDTTDATQKAITGAFNNDDGVQKQLEKALKFKAGEVGGIAKQAAQDTLDALKDNQQLTDAQLKLVGISRDQYIKLLADRAYYTSTWGKKLSDNLSGYGSIINPETQITGENVASAEDYARYAALNELMGLKNQYLNDPSLADTANLDLLNYDYNNAQSTITQTIGSQLYADAQAEAEFRAAEQRAAEQRARDEQKETITGAVLGSIAGPIGAVIGGAVCFLKNTPIKMADGSFKMVQDLQLGNNTYIGGMVTARGEGFCTELTEYKGRFTSPNHAIFDGKHWNRAKNVEGSNTYILDVPSIVYPIVNEKHILITDNGVVYADLIEHDDSVGMSDEDKIKILNNSEYLEYTKQVEETIQCKSTNLIHKNTTKV